jgi:hypothetical protein
MGTDLVSTGLNETVDPENALLSGHGGSDGNVKLCVHHDELLYPTGAVVVHYA